MLRKLYHFLLDSIQTLVLAAALFLVIYVFIAQPFQVDGLSMYPTFDHKEQILTNKIGLRFSEPKHSEVVVFELSGQQDKRDLIKRVIAVPGDTVMLAAGDVFLNSSRLDENKYLDREVKTYPGAFLPENQTVTVPTDSYFVLGDNRPHSSDSRAFGFVKKDQIIGKSFLVYWPLNRLRLVQTP